MPQWKPTESAPQNTCVLVWWPFVEVGDDEDSTSEHVGGNVLISCLSGGAWSEPDEIEATGAYFGDDHEYADAPSHWMPLPKPPAGVNA